jgi:hypothetical protein
MDMKTSFLNLWKAAIFLLLVLFLPAGGIQAVQVPDPDGMYWDGRFDDIIKYFRDKKFQALSLNEKLLYIECLARIGRSADALEKLGQIPFDGPGKKEIQACAGWVYFSLGNFEKAGEFWKEPLRTEGIPNRPFFGKVMLLLFLKQVAEAEQLFFQILKEYPDKSQCFQVFLIGIEVFNATRKPAELFKWYSNRADMVRKNDRQTYLNLRANARLYRRIRNKNLFETRTESDLVAIPFVETGRNRFMLINFQPAGGRTYKILLDTGNATGWMIHDRELYDDLKLKTGGKIVASIGTEIEALDGYRIYNEKLDLDGLEIFHLVGYYIPKPRPDFFDANFNPSFIRNRVVTLDGQQKKMILRSKKAFDLYLNAIPSRRVVKLPWYGYEQVFVPVVVNRIHSGLGIIETGAEDIAIKLDFARIIQLPLLPRLKYLSNGRIFRFFETSVDVSLGMFRFERKSAEVWSFNRFSRHLSGLKADVVLGPQVFLGNGYIVSFDPFDRVMVVEGGNL